MSTATVSSANPQQQTPDGVSAMGNVAVGSATGTTASAPRSTGTQDNHSGSPPVSLPPTPQRSANSQNHTEGEDDHHHVDHARRKVQTSAVVVGDPQVPANTSSGSGSGGGGGLISLAEVDTSDTLHPAARAGHTLVSRGGFSRHTASRDAIHGRGAFTSTWLYSRDTTWCVWHSFVHPSVEAKFIDMIVTYRKPKIALALILTIFTFTVNTAGTTRSASFAIRVGFVVGSLLYGIAAFVFTSQLVVTNRRGDSSRKGLDGLAKGNVDEGGHRRPSVNENVYPGSPRGSTAASSSHNAAPPPAASLPQQLPVPSNTDRSQSTLANFCLPYLPPQLEETFTVAFIYGPLFVSMIVTSLTKLACYGFTGPLRDAYCYRSWYVESINLGALMLAITAAPVRSQYVMIVSCCIWLAFVIVPLLLPRETFHLARYVSASLIGACEIALCMATAVIRDHSFRETFTVGELLREQLEEVQRVKKQLHAVALKRLPEHVVVSVARRGYFHRASRGGFVVAFGPGGLHQRVRHDCAAALLGIVSAVSRHVEWAMQPLVESGGATKFLTWGDAFAYCVCPLPHETRRVASELRIAITRATEQQQHHPSVDTAWVPGDSGAASSSGGPSDSAVRTQPASTLPGKNTALAAAGAAAQLRGTHQNSGSENSNEHGGASAAVAVVGDDHDHHTTLPIVASVSYGSVEVKFVALLRSVVATGDAVAECLDPLYLALAADTRAKQQHNRNDVQSASRRGGSGSSTALCFPNSDAVLLTEAAAKLLRVADEERLPSSGGRRTRVAKILDEPTPSRSGSDTYEPVVDPPLAVDVALPHFFEDTGNPLSSRLASVSAASASGCSAVVTDRSRVSEPSSLSSPATSTEPGGDLSLSNALYATRISWTGLRYVRPEMEDSFHKHNAASSVHTIRVHAWFMLSFCLILYITAAMYRAAVWTVFMPLPYIAFASVVAILFHFTVWVTYTLPLATQSSRPGDSMLLVPTCCSSNSRRSSRCDVYSMFVPAMSLGYGVDGGGSATYHLTDASADRVAWGFLDALYWLFTMSISAAAMTLSSGLYPVGGVLIGPVSLVSLTLLTNRPQWGSATLLWTVDAAAALWLVAYGAVLSDSEAKALGFALIYVGCGAAAATLSARVLLDQRAREKFSQEQQLRVAKDEVLAMTKRLRLTLSQVMTDRDVEKFLRIQQNAAAAAAREGRDGAESRLRTGAMTSLLSRGGGGGRGGGGATLARALVPARGGDPRIPGEAANTSTEVKTTTEDRAYAILLLQAEELADGSNSSSSGSGDGGGGGQRGTLFPVVGGDGNQVSTTAMRHSTSADVATIILRMTASSIPPVFARVHDNFITLVADVVDPISLSAATSLGPLLDLVDRMRRTLPVAACAWVGMTPMVGAMVGTHSPNFDWFAPELITARTSLLTGPAVPRARALNPNLRWGRTVVTSRAAYHLLVQLNLSTAETNHLRARATCHRAAAGPAPQIAAPLWSVGSLLRCATKLTGQVSLHLVEPRQDDGQEQPPPAIEATHRAPSQQERRIRR